MNRAVLFDCDGVLVDSEDGLSKIAAYVLNTFYNLPATPDDFIPFIGTGEDIYIGEVVRKHSGLYIQEMKSKIYNEYIQSAKKYVDPIKGARDLIVNLRNLGYKVAVASSADLPKVDVNLQILGLDYCDFDAVITGNDVEKKKPAPDIYLVASKKCNVLPVNCIVVEDATSGVLSGKKAGMTVVGFTSSVSEALLKSSGADYTVSTMAELGILLTELNLKVSSVNSNIKEVLR